MNRLPIYINDPNVSDSSLGDELVFSRAEYNEFIRVTKEAGAYADFSNNISLRCEICGSFITTTESIYHTIAQIKNRLHPDIEIIDYVFSKILIPVTLTDKEWERYQRGGISLKPVDPDVDPIYDYCDGFRFIAEESAFIFDRECSCDSVMAGEHVA